jgi:hypothetical protein
VEFLVNFQAKQVLKPKPPMPEVQKEKVEKENTKNSRYLYLYFFEYFYSALSTLGMCAADFCLHNQGLFCLDVVWLWSCEFELGKKHAKHQKDISSNT